MKTTIIKNSKTFLRGILQTSPGSVMLVAVEGVSILPMGTSRVSLKYKQKKSLINY